MSPKKAVHILAIGVVELQCLAEVIDLLFRNMDDVGVSVGGPGRITALSTYVNSYCGHKLDVHCFLLDVRLRYSSTGREACGRNQGMQKGCLCSWSRVLTRLPQPERS